MLFGRIPFLYQPEEYLVKEYELIFVIKPDLTDQDIGTVKAEVKRHVENLNGTVEREDDWGKKQLAFEVKDYTEGHYMFFEVKLPPESPGPLKDQLKIDERVIRYMLTLKQTKKIAESKKA